MKMAATLLDRLLENETLSLVRELVHGAVLEAQANPAVAIRSFELNRYDLTLRFEDGSVLIEDELDASDAGALEMPLAQFLQALG